jgi:hypothetical protein
MPTMVIIVFIYWPFWRTLYIYAYLHVQIWFHIIWRLTFIQIIVYVNLYYNIATIYFYYLFCLGNLCFNQQNV